MLLYGPQISVLFPAQSATFHTQTFAVPLSTPTSSLLSDPVVQV